MDVHRHWEDVHASKGEEVSWWQSEPDLWLDLIDMLDLRPDDPIVDIGSGSSLLVDALIRRGSGAVTAVDVSRSALDRIAARLGDAVNLVRTNVLDFRPATPVRLWHDRAVFHFLTEPEDRELYRDNLHASLRSDGYVMVATFAPDGPETCSGLPVVNYSADDLAQTLGVRLVRADRRIHTTPWGTAQPFTLVVGVP